MLLLITDSIPEKYYVNNVRLIIWMIHRGYKYDLGLEELEGRIGKIYWFYITKKPS